MKKTPHIKLYFQNINSAKNERFQNIPEELIKQISLDLKSNNFVFFFSETLIFNLFVA